MFKDKIKEYRLKSKLTIAQFAEKVNVAVYTVVKWENGKALPSSDTLDLICFVLNVSDKELLEESELKKVLRKNKLKSVFSKTILNIFLVFLIIWILTTSLEYCYKTSVTSDIISLLNKPIIINKNF